MIDTLWVDVGYCRGGAVCSDENIVYDARGFGDIYRYHFSDTFHITQGINNMSSQRIDRKRPISCHSQSEFPYFNSS